MTGTTEITIVTGERYVVQGEAKAVERAILDAARGSLMELAWMIESETGRPVAFNPAYVVMLRAPRPERSLPA
jgi:hypothetical protein